MILGFAAYYSISRSKIALLLCLYAGAYESYFMIVGTIQDDKTAQNVTISNNSDLVFLREKAERVRNHYLTLKERYEQKGSDVYTNPWFKKKLLDPAWADNEAAQKEIELRKASLESTHDGQKVTELKVFYRLGLVFLCMVLTHCIFDRRLAGTSAVMR